MKKKRREASHQHSRVNTVDYLLERHLIGDTNDRSYDLRPPSQRQAKGTPPPWRSFRGKKMNETLQMVNTGRCFISIGHFGHGFKISHALRDPRGIRMGCRDAACLFYCQQST
ncbi:hypothetical protein NC652_026598 [Populus alba x Populus x berolinensis]|nr:hypothetical protein NC652_026598 [Populus alba x Populus x berolinensis]